MIDNIIDKLGKDNNIIEAFDKSTLNVIKDSVFNDRIGLAQKHFELRWEVLNYLDGRKTKWEVEEAHEQLRKHINSQKEQEWSFINGNEYNIALGVLMRHMGTLLGPRFNAGYYLKPILKAKNTDVIKKKIIELYKRSNSKINHINGGRVQQLLDRIIEKEEIKIDAEMMLAGYVKDSLIYEKEINKKTRGI